jgi:Coenzyme PQQ synthesis protein D (PqqD)
VSVPPGPPLPHERLAINASKVVHETMDGEVIVIDLETGDYYSLRGAGFDAWALLRRGRTAEEIASVIESRYAGGADRADIRADTYEVLGKLYDASVIVQDASAGSDPVAASADDLPDDDRPYQRPILERYTDMQEYLLVDPIHGVDERGWPAGTAAPG